MSRDLEYLTYHEKRRLDYLHSNYHYLNEREQLEYNYLLKKSQGAFVEETNTPPAFEEEEVSDELEEVVEDLPVYQSRSQKSKKKATVPPQNRPKIPRKKVRVKRILKWIALFFLLIIGGMVFMFVKGLNSKVQMPNRLSLRNLTARSHETGSISSSWGQMVESVRSQMKPGQTPSWWSMSIIKKARSRWSASCGTH